MKFLATMLALLPSLALAAPAKDTILLNKDTIVFRGEVNGETVGAVTQKILQTEGDRVTMFISSPGGSVFDGLALKQVMNASGKKFLCVSDFSASMAFALMQVCDERVVMENSVLMQHYASFGVQAQPENKVDTFMGLIKSSLAQLESFQAARIGKSVAAFKNDIRDDLWLYGAQAVKYGAADRVAPVTCDAATTKATYTEDVMVFIFKLKVTWSQCPLITNPLKVEAPSQEAQTQFFKTFVNFRNAQGVIRQ